MKIHNIYITTGNRGSFIIAAFKIHNIYLSAGSRGHRGMLSPVHLRLAQFHTCAEGMRHNTIYDSYHFYDKLANQPLLDYTSIDKVVGLNALQFFIIL
jgi:hypothetical protein